MFFCEPDSVPACDTDVAVALVVILVVAAILSRWID